MIYSRNVVHAGILLSLKISSYFIHTNLNLNLLGSLRPHKTLSYVIFQNIFSASKTREVRVMGSN